MSGSLARTPLQKALEAVRAGRRICKCECGGNVSGNETAGYVGSWCDRCTPVVKVELAKERACPTRS